MNDSLTKDQGAYQWSVRWTADKRPQLMIELLMISPQGYQLISCPFWKLMRQV